jgi:hypothetical protein
LIAIAGNRAHCDRVAKPPAQKSRSQILDEITAFMKRHVGPMHHWYVGTAASARTQMFEVHKFQSNDIGIFRNVGSEVDAASMAALLIGRGTKGDASIKLGASSVYVFKLTSHSKPALPS